MNPAFASLRALFPAAIAVAAAVAGGTVQSNPASLPFSACGERARLRAGLDPAIPPAAALLAAAQSLGRVRMSADTAEHLHTARKLQFACLDALADLPGTAELPWLAWLQQGMRRDADEGLALFRAAHRADPGGSMQRAMTVEQRTTPVELRLWCHRVFWLNDPDIALQRGGRLLRESERGTENLHLRFIRDVAAAQVGPQAKELLLAAVHRNALDGAARRAAVDALVERGATDLAADMASLFLASTGDLIVRKAGLLATLELAPAMGEKLLMDSVPPRDVQPGLYALVRELRAERGLPPLP